MSKRRLGALTRFQITIGTMLANGFLIARSKMEQAHETLLNYEQALRVEHGLDENWRINDWQRGFEYVEPEIDAEGILAQISAGGMIDTFSGGNNGSSN